MIQISITRQQGDVKLEKLVDRTGMHRPVVMGTKAMISSGRPQATLAGIEILKKGGNAIDAGIAMGLCTM